MQWGNNSTAQRTKQFRAPVLNQMEEWTNAVRSKCCRSVRWHKVRFDPDYFDKSSLLRGMERGEEGFWTDLAGLELKYLTKIL